MFIGILIVGFSGGVFGATINSASCEQVDVRAAIDSAVDGDTVLVPAGSCVWVTSAQVIITKYISVIGAGIDLTIITDNTTRDHSPWFINVNSANDGEVRVSGFTFSEAGAGSSSALIQGGIHGINTGGSFIISDNKFEGVLRQPLLVSGLRGLVSNNLFLNSVRSKVHGPGEGINSWDDSWTKLTIPGSVDAWYFENNTWTTPINTDGMIDCEYGGKYVARYNNVEVADNFGGCVFFNHGYDSVYRGCANMEIYNNNIHHEGTSWPYMPIWFRGGTGVVFGNVITGRWSSGGSLGGLTNFRSCSNSTYYNAVGICVGGTEDGIACRGSTSSYAIACVNGGGVCNFDNCVGTNPADGNTDGGNGYACRDQIGRGGNQELLPIYEWDNTKDGVIAHFSAPWSLQGCTGDDYIIDHVQENRDYYNHNLLFDGTSGIGKGTLSSRPLTCIIGVGYWATDQGEWNSENAGADGQMYKCTSTNTWTAYYTPYTYPHPLTLLGDPTCSELGGVDCCIGGETCDGTSYGTASDCSGICCSVVCTSSSTCSSADNNPVDGVVDIIELMDYISQWKSGSVTITELMTGIGEWKNGC